MAVAITVSVAASFWLQSVSTGYMRYERVEVIGAFSEFRKVELGVVGTGWTYVGFSGENMTGWQVSIHLRNMGTKNIALTDAKINGKLIDLYSPKIETDNVTGVVFDATIVPGELSTVYLYIPMYVEDAHPGHFGHGLMINVELMTASGYSYSRIVELS